MTDPIAANWPQIAAAAWPLWFAIGAVLIVGTAEHWSRLLDRLLARQCRHTLNALVGDHRCRCFGRAGHQMPHVCPCGCQWWPWRSRGLNRYLRGGRWGVK